MAYASDASYRAGVLALTRGISWASQNARCSDGAGRICICRYLRHRSRLLTALHTPQSALIPDVVATSIVFLALLGGFGACAGGAPWIKAAVRVTFRGALAMAIAAGVEAILGAVV